MQMNLDRVRALVPGREIDWLAEVDSTMYAAIARGANGCAAGTVIGAETQTAGHGRYGRQWHSETGSGLYFSVVLRPDLADRALLPMITFALGLAVAGAIESATALAPDLRWPNDVLLGGRKCAGILTEMQGDAIVAGIGVNINQRGFPAELAAIATSLAIESGREHSREVLLAGILGAIDEQCAMLVEGGAQRILDLFARASSYVCGRRVAVELGGREVTGVTKGLTPAGYLRLACDDGREETIIAGGVRPCS